MMAGALQHLRAQRVFQLLDRPAQRRLRDMQTFRRAREAQLFRDGLKIAQMTQFHATGGYNSTASR